MVQVDQRLGLFLPPQETSGHKIAAVLGTDSRLLAACGLVHSAAGLAELVCS